MRLLAPKPYDDELLSSVWSRMCRRTGLPITAVTSAILGRKWTPGFFQAGHMFETAAMLRLPGEQLLQHHTVFPYATAFTEPRVHASALANALSTGLTARGTGAVTQSVSDNVDGRRWCNQCAREELARSGESYWHRSHNLPGVLVCLKHRAMLSHAQWLPSNGNRSWSYALPHEAMEMDGVGSDSPTSNMSNKGRRFLNTLALRSIEALQSEHGAFSTQGQGWPAWYREQLVARGLLTPGRQADGRLLADFVRRQVAGSMRDPLAAEGARPAIDAGTDTDTDTDANADEAANDGLQPQQSDFGWLQLMIRPGQAIPFIPLKHLIFQTALELCPQDGASERLDHSPVGYQGKARAPIDARCSKEFRLIVDSALEQGAKVSVLDALRQVGVWQLYRHNAAEFPLVTAEVKRLRVSEASLRRTSMRRIAMTANRYREAQGQARANQI
jgi:hypothetical protein